MDQPAKRVLTVGGAMIDTIALIESDRIERMSMNNADKAFLLLEEGRKTEAALISTHPGGGAVNAAVAFARLGFNVAALIKIGRDARGAAIVSALAAEAISAECIVHTDDAATGASVLISSHHRNAAIFTFRGANSLLVESEIAQDLYKSDVVYIASLSDGSADVFPFLVARASEQGAFVVANPGIRQLAARGEAFQKALPKLDVLSMNRDEAAALVPTLSARQRRASRRMTSPADAPDLMRRGLSASGFDMAFMQFIEVVVGLGVGTILVTDGARGAYAANRSEIVYCPSLPVEVVGTAGAGDAFTATFCAYLAEGRTLSDALQYATVNASSVVMFADTQSGLLPRASVEATKADKTPDLAVRAWPIN
ncbi:MAG: carbohydrate kinase family protein [Hyphomicrobium sp.]